MLKKSHGPAFRVVRADLHKCPDCLGKALINGIFHQMACVTCNASGWVDAAGQALSLDELVIQLTLHLQLAQQQIAALKRPRQGAQSQYEQNNRLGPGGANYTGD